MELNTRSGTAGFDLLNSALTCEPKVNQNYMIKNNQKFENKFTGIIYD